MVETLPWSLTPRHHRGSLHMCLWLLGSSTCRTIPSLLTQETKGLATHQQSPSL